MSPLLALSLSSSSFNQHHLKSIKCENLEMAKSTKIHSSLCYWINQALLPYFLPPSIVTKYKFDVKILNQSRDFLLATVLISPPTWDLISEIRCRPLLESPWEGSALAARLMSDILEGTWETDGKPRKTQETSKHHFAFFLVHCGNGFFLSHRRRTTILQGINLPQRLSLSSWKKPHSSWFFSRYKKIMFYL